MIIKFLIASILFVSNMVYVNSKLFYVEVKYPLLGDEPPPGTVWPKPHIMKETSSKTYVLASNKFNITSNLIHDCDIITENTRRYLDILFPPKSEFIGYESSDDLLTQLEILIAENEFCPGYPDSHMDEAYELEILDGKAVLRSTTVWGALRGLETFSQLTYINDLEQLVINGSTYIRDYPRFNHRGILLDTSRHFIPLKVLKKQLDAMQYSKFNVLHWHIVDDQSFPFESLKYPDLSRKGAYTKNHIYTQQDVRNLIDHARLRGIRIIPEFDSPGHTESFGRTFPELITVCWNNGKPYQAIYGLQGKAEILNPIIEELYPVIENILSEIKDVFVDEFIHLGNDEVYYNCWKSNPNITEWMKKMNITEYHELEAYYSRRVLNITKNLNKKATVWQDVYDNGVRPDNSTQIQIWKDSSTTGGSKSWRTYLHDITSNGYKVILSSPWYINFLSYGFEEWYKFYEVEPSKRWYGTDEQFKLIEGGEACLWGEYVDASNIETRLWPRASVIAERLWSPASANNPEEAKYRLDEMRCRLLRRGIPAAPISPNGYCGDFEVNMEKSVIHESVFNY